MLISGSGVLLNRMCFCIGIVSLLSSCSSVDLFVLIWLRIVICLFGLIDRFGILSIGFVCGLKLYLICLK